MRSKLALRFLVPLALMSLASCGPTTDSEVQVTGKTTNPCAFIALANYDKAFNKALEAELNGAPASAVWPKAIADYHELRKAVAACKA